MAYYEIQRSDQHRWEAQPRWGLVGRHPSLARCVEGIGRILIPMIGEIPREPNRYRIAEFKGNVAGKGKLVALYDYQGVRIVAAKPRKALVRKPKRIAA